MSRLRHRPFSRQEFALVHALNSTPNYGPNYGPQYGLHYGRIGHFVHPGTPLNWKNLHFLLGANREGESIETLTFQNQDNCGEAVGVMGPTIQSNSTT